MYYIASVKKSHILLYHISQTKSTDEKKFYHFFNKKTHTCVCEFLLVETAGIEPATSCMSSMHSNQLSYASKAYILYHICFGIAIAFWNIFYYFLFFTIKFQPFWSAFSFCAGRGAYGRCLWSRSPWTLRGWSRGRGSRQSYIPAWPPRG